MTIIFNLSFQNGGQSIINNSELYDLLEDDNMVRLSNISVGNTTHQNLPDDFRELMRKTIISLILGLIILITIIGKLNT